MANRILNISLWVTLLAALLFSFSQLFSDEIKIDEFFFLANIYNKTLHNNMPGFAWNGVSELDIASFEQIMTIFSPRENREILNFWEALSQDYSFFLSHYQELTNHPPLSYLIAKPFSYMFQDQIFAMRFYSFLSYVFCLPVVFFLAKELGIKDRQTRFTSIVLFAAMSMSSFLGSYAKGYALQLLLMLIAIYSFLRALNHLKASCKPSSCIYLFTDKHNKAGSPSLGVHFSADKQSAAQLLLSLVFSILAIFCHHFSLLLLGGIFLVLVIWQAFSERSFNCVFGVFLGVFALISIALLPLIQLQKEQTTVSVFAGNYDVMTEISEAWTNYWQLLVFNYDASLFTYSVSALLLFLIFIHLSKSNTESRILLVLVFALSLIPSLVIFFADLALNYHFVKASRFILLALPFIGIIYAVLLRAQARLLSMLVLMLLLGNLLNSSAQDKKWIMPPAQKMQKLAKHWSEQEFKEPVLFVLKNYRASQLAFPVYLQINMSKRYANWQQSPAYNKVFFVSEKADLRKIPAGLRLIRL